MLSFANRKVVAIGEAMVELAPVGDGLYAKGFAGDTFNTLWHMAGLLGTKAQFGYISRVGDDRVSDDFLAQCVADGLDVSGISRDPARTMGLYLIELDGVERSFTYWRNMSAARSLADDPDRLLRSIDGAGLIHLSGITLAILSPTARDTLFDVLAHARKAGSLVCFDPNIRARLWASPEEIRNTLATMLALVDIALPSFDDEATHWGDAKPETTLARFAAAGVREVVVKNGAGTVFLLSDGMQSMVETPPVTGIKDTTGAGDAFNAGYLAARIMGRSAVQAVSAGQAVSAEVIRTPGARADKGRIRHLSGQLGLE